MRDIRNTALLAALVAGLLLLAGLGVLFVLESGEGNETESALDGQVNSYARQQAFSSPALTLAQQTETTAGWNWLYHPDRKACVGQQTIGQQTSAPIPVTGGSVAIGTIGVVSLTLPAGATVYPLMSVDLGNQVYDIPYLPAQERNGTGYASFNGGRFAVLDGDIPGSQQATAQLEIVPTLASDCYGLVTASWRQQAVIAVSTAFGAVAHVTPHPPTPVPPVPTPTHVAAQSVARPDIPDVATAGNLLRPLTYHEDRDGYVVAEMYQDLRAGNYDEEGILQNDSWRYTAAEQACELSLLLAWQEGYDVRPHQTPWPTWTPVPTQTPWPTWTPWPTATPIVVAVVLPAIYDREADGGDTQLLTDRMLVLTPTPTPTPIPPPDVAAIPDTEVWRGADDGLWDGDSFTTTVVPNELREDPDGNRTYTLTVGGTWVQGTNSRPGWMQVRFAADTATEGNSCADDGVDFVAADSNYAAASSRTVSVTVCADSIAEAMGETFKVEVELQQTETIDSKDGGRDIISTAYVQILDPEPEQPAQDPVQGERPTQRPQATQPPQPPQPTPPYAQSVTWGGWQNRTLSVSLDGVAALEGVPDTAQIYAWTEIRLGADAGTATPFGRFPAYWEAGLLHLWAGSGRLVVPSHQFVIDASHRELWLHARIAPIPNCRSLTLQWQRQAAAEVAALDTVNPFAEWVAPTLTPTPTPSPTPTPTGTPPPPQPTPTPIPATEHSYYALLVSKAEYADITSEAAKKHIEDTVLNGDCDENSLSWCAASDTGANVWVTGAASGTGGDYWLVFVVPVDAVASIQQANNPIELRPAFFTPAVRLTGTAGKYYLATRQAWLAASASATRGSWKLE